MQWFTFFLVGMVTWVEFNGADGACVVNDLYVE